MQHLTSELVYWITERYAMKARKESYDFPLMKYGFSDDPHMGTVRYCNVHREDDKVTRWIRTYWNKPDDPAWKFVLGRMVNLPETLSSMSAWNTPEQMKITMQQKRDAGFKVWTSAYTISTCGKSMDKIDYVFDWVVWGVAQAGDLDYSSCHDCWENLQNVYGLGSFLAAQVVADMKNTEGHPLQKAEDWWTFSAPGPGSLRGLSWYFSGTPTGVTASFYQSALNVCRSEVDPLIPKHIPRISDQDFQNCLCEFSKYMKVKVLNGHVRNKYAASRSVHV